VQGFAGCRIRAIEAVDPIALRVNTPSERIESRRLNLIGLGWIVALLADNVPHPGCVQTPAPGRTR
jgi:hypothetical protein